MLTYVQTFHRELLTSELAQARQRRAVARNARLFMLAVATVALLGFVL